MNSSLKTGFAAAITILFLGSLTNNGCEKRDHDDCDGRPLDSCQVDTCTADSCLPDTCVGDTCDSLAECPPGISGQWELLGLLEEQITSIAFHPINPNIIYAATDWDFSFGKLGVLYKSEDCCLTWDTLGLASGSILDVTIDPVNPQIIYASPYNLVKSTDGGVTWQESSNGIQIDFDTRVLAFTMEPWNTNVLYVATGGFFGGKLYKSTDGGTSWVRILRPQSESVSCVELDLKNPGTIYAGLNWSGTLMKSTDYGATWDTTGLKLIYENLDDILIDDDGCIYVAMSGGIGRSCDSGKTWSAFNEGFEQSVSITKIIKNSITNDFFSTPNNTFLYRRNATDTSWVIFPVGDGTVGFGVIDLKLSNDQRFLYVGPKGLYRYRFP